MLNVLNVMKKLSFSWPDHFELVDGDMETRLLESKIVIVSDSSVMVEAVHMGKSTIVVGKETDIRAFYDWR